MLMVLASCGSKSNKSKRTVGPNSTSFGAEEIDISKQSELSLEQKIEYITRKKDKWLKTDSLTKQMFQTF